MIIESAFLREQELVELIMLIRKHAARAPMLNWKPGECGSSTANLSALNNKTVIEVERRIALHLALDAARKEELRGVMYEAGQGYRVHHDAFHSDNREWDRFASDGGNRTWSALIYLNTLSGGGETVFPELGLAIEPRAGQLIAWQNLRDDGEPDTRMVHSAAPHKGCEKFIVQQWFRGSET